MPQPVRQPPTGHLPRAVSPDLLWAGGCLPVQYQGVEVHGHFSCYVLRGASKTILIDTGHPAHWETIAPGVLDFLDGRPLDYVFITHAELPHGGLIQNWLHRFPNATAVGDLRGYDIYYPELAHRFRTVTVGDRLDLGDRDFVFVPAVWRDLNNTLWGFETAGRTLFVSDAFASLHYHKVGQCDFVTSERGPLDRDMIVFFNERALNWTRFTDARVTFADIDNLFSQLRPRAIAGAHGSPIDAVEDVLPMMKNGMVVGA